MIAWTFHASFRQTLFASRENRSVQLGPYDIEREMHTEIAEPSLHGKGTQRRISLCQNMYRLWTTYREDWIFQLCLTCVVLTLGVILLSFQAFCSVLPIPKICNLCTIGIDFDRSLVGSVFDEDDQPVDVCSKRNPKLPQTSDGGDAQRSKYNKLMAIIISRHVNKA